MDSEQLFREFYPQASTSPKTMQNTMRAAMLLSYVPQFKLMSGGWLGNVLLRFTVPPFLREVVKPPLPEVIDLRMFQLEDGAYLFHVKHPVRSEMNEDSWFVKMTTLWTDASVGMTGPFHPTFLLGMKKSAKDYLQHGADNEHVFGSYHSDGFGIYINATNVEVYLGGSGVNTELLPQPLQDILLQLHTLPPLAETINGLPESTISAEERAQIMGITEDKCRWTDYTAEKCNGDTFDPVTHDDFEEGDKVWQTSSGQCFGPDPGHGGFYQPFYFPNSDILRNPVNRARLDRSCFWRIPRPDSEFPPQRRVRQRRV